MHTEKRLNVSALNSKKSDIPIKTIQQFFLSFIKNIELNMKVEIYRNARVQQNNIFLIENRNGFRSVLFCFFYSQ